MMTLKTVKNYGQFAVEMETNIADEPGRTRIAAQTFWADTEDGWDVGND
jgi:hypothetical protein